MPVKYSHPPIKRGNSQEAKQRSRGGLGGI